MTQPSNPQPSIADKISELVRQAVVPGGATVGGIGAFWELLINDEGEVIKAVASAVIGLGLSYGATLLKPSHRSAQRRIDHAGKLLDQTTDLMFAKITGFEGKYLLCQALDCEGVRSEGMRDRDGIFEPELKDVFVELKIDGNSRPPGFWDKMRRKPQIDVSRNQTLWDILALKHQKPYRQLAILAWGGFGKTTLLKHVAYRYGMGEAPPNAPNLVPVLLVLRKCRKQLLSAEPLDLPTLINEYHIPSLPESSRLQPVPPNWAKDMLRKGRALVMFDGFDEVPRDERPAVVRWLHEQMRQYGQSVFLVTSRPKAYRDESSAAQLAMAMPLWVQPFDDEQRRKFVLNWYQCQEVLKARRNTPEVRKVATNAAEDLLLQIESQPKLRDLSQNPLLLNMIATFHRLYPEAALPRRRVDLYKDICALQLEMRPKDRGLKTVLLKFEVRLVLEQVAFNMMQHELKRINRDDLLAEMATALMIQEEEIEATELLRDVTRISELMVQQEDEYEFAHLSFQEYLASAYVAASADERERVLYENLSASWWKDTILLYVAQLKKPDRLIGEAMERGAVDLAYECLQQTDRRVEKALVEQVKAARYADLEQHLRNGDWEAADDETYRLMITEVGKEKGQWFDYRELLNFPCEPLKTIDGLWVRHSGGKFGFSVQKEMYLECGGIPDGKYHKEAWEKLCNMNGWDAEVEYNLESPNGHLPVLGHFTRPWTLWTLSGVWRGIFSRIQTCKL